MTEENNSNKNDLDIIKKKTIKRNSVQQGDIFGDKILLNDFFFFKNEVLNEIKHLDLKINSQNNINNEMNKKLISYNSKIEDLSKKVDDFSSLINKKSSESNYYTEKIDALYEFKSKIEQESITQNCKLKLMAEELKTAINKYDKLITNNIIYPGIIGIDSKFKDYHDFVDYVLLEIQNFSLFKDKNVIDLKSYKNKVESNIKSLNIQVQSLLNNANSYALKKIKDSEEKIFNEIGLFDEKFGQVRVEYVNWINRVEKQYEEMKNEWSKILSLKKDVSELIEKNVENINNSNNNMRKLFSDHQAEINEIKNNYVLLLKIIKKIEEKKSNNNDIRKSIIKSGPKREINNINEKKEINPNEKINSDNIQKKEGKISIKKRNRSNRLTKVKTVESILKQYIQGKRSLNQLLEKREKKYQKENKNNDCPVSIVTLVSFKQLYDDSIKNFSRNNIYRTIEDRPKSQSNISTEKNINIKSANKSMNNSPKYRKIIDRNFNNIKQKFNTRLKYSEKKKILLIKEGEKNTRNKSKESEIKNTTLNNENEKYTLNNKNPNLKQLNDISFLIEDKKDNKFPKIEENKAKQIEIYKKIEQQHKIKNIISSKRKKNKNKSISLIKSNNRNENIYLINNAKSSGIKYNLSSENIFGYYKNISKIRNKESKLDSIIKSNTININEYKNNK